jgi:hypothetical protein
LSSQAPIFFLSPQALFFCQPEPHFLSPRVKARGSLSAYPPRDDTVGGCLPKPP